MPHCRPAERSGIADTAACLSGTSRKYPAYDDLPEGGPPFHPRCSKGTRPFVEEYATAEQIEQAQGPRGGDPRRLLGMSAQAAQRAYKDLQIRPQIESHYRRITPLAGREFSIGPGDDPRFQADLIHKLGVRNVELAGRADIGAAVAKGLQRVAMAGGAMPDEVRVTVQEFDGPNQIAGFAPSSKSLFLNPA